MKSINIDDEATARSIIELLCSQNEDTQLIESFSSAIEAIKYLNQEEEVELIFFGHSYACFYGL